MKKRQISFAAAEGGDSYKWERQPCDRGMVRENLEKYRAEL